MHRFSRLLLVALLLGTLAQVSAQEDSAGQAMNPAQTTHVRFAHFSPDSTDIDVYLNSNRMELDALTYPTVTEWLALPAGQYDVAFVPDGEEINNATFEPVFLDLAAQTWYTITAIGSSDSGETEVVVFSEDTDSLIPGTARVTFFNALDNGEGVDFYRNEVPFTTGLAFGETFTEEHDVETYMYQAVTGGQNPAVVAELGDISLREGRNYLVAAVGTPSASGDQAPLIEIVETNQAEFLVGLGMLEAPGTVVQAVEAEDLAGDFAAAIEAANLTETLSERGPFTVFVPADFSLDRLGTEDAAELAAILSNHIVLGELLSQDLANADRVTTLSGRRLPVRVRNNAIHIGDARVLTVNIPATNGVVHIINGVLMPEGE